MNKLTNAMTVDVEDYFQVSAFEKVISRDSWDSMPVRVEKNTHRVMDIFAEHDVKATFFMLGWVADRYPGLVERITKEGHELASHGYAHLRVTSQTRAEFREDIDRTKRLLEDMSGTEVKGYRAPSYSIGKANLWAHEEIQEAGYQYSSSVYPVHHDLYGFPEAPRYMFKCREKLIEIPISTLPFGKRNIPIGGGGYFRLYPYALSRWAINKVNTDENKSTLFYFHPWEIDPDQPRQQASLKSRFRHYLNLGRMENRLHSLLKDFNWGRMDDVYLSQAVDSPAKQAS
jgi:polysaccharide deacetylase family protein (PEP-CTERM system associated)